MGVIRGLCWGLFGLGFRIYRVWGVVGIRFGPFTNGRCILEFIMYGDQSLHLRGFHTSKCIKRLEARGMVW